MVTIISQSDHHNHHHHHDAQTGCLTCSTNFLPSTQCLASQSSRLWHIPILRLTIDHDSYADDDDDGDDQANPDITIQNAPQAYYDPSDEPVAESPFKFEVGHRHL